MNRKRFIRATLIMAAIIIVGLYVRIDYFIVRPSRAVELGTLISVENAFDDQDRGRLYLVTISQQRASIFTAIYGYIHPYMEVKAIDTVIPDGMDEVEYRQQLREIMSESQQLAQVVALRRAGYEVDILSDGVIVIGLLDEAPAENYLEEGDLIIEVDNSRVSLATEVSAIVQDRLVGEEVKLLVTRQEVNLELIIPTGANPDDSDMPFLGILIQTSSLEPQIPIAIEMNTGRIGGPSAGLMFVLEILNQLTPEDITRGKSIAGTGTIDLNENIGRVGGVRQKVVAAKNAGAEIFFVPFGNYDQAAGVIGNIEVVPVKNLEEVLFYINNLE